jgi:hypothetical protein
MYMFFCGSISQHFSRKMPWGTIIGSNGSCKLFTKLPHHFSRMFAPFYYHEHYITDPVSPHIPKHLILILNFISYSDRCLVIHYYHLIFYVFMVLEIEHMVLHIPRKCSTTKLPSPNCNSRVLFCQCWWSNPGFYTC